MIVGGYELHLYCDEGDCKMPEFHLISNSDFGVFCGLKSSTCHYLARAAGWSLNFKNRTAKCPFCTGKAKP